MTSFPYIIAIHLVFGLGLGIIMHRSDFCMAGMFRDVFLLNDYYRMRSLLLLIVLTSLLLYLGRISGIVASYPPSFFGTPSITNLLGGVIFGTGMVLAGGCAVGTLYKMGAGNLVSLFAFAGMIFGSLLFAELYAFNLSLTDATTMTVNKTSAEHIVGNAGLPVLALTAFAAFFFYRWIKEKKWIEKTYAHGHLLPWKAAMLIALITMLSFILSGRPLSVTSGFAKLSAYLGEQISPVYIADKPFFREDSLRLLNSTVTSGRLGTGIDSIALTQVPMIAGVVIGSFVSAVRLREFRIGHLPPLRQILSALSGGIMMALGSLMAGGCNVWHIMGGLPVFALQSLLFVSGLTAGSYFGTYMLRRIVV